jgi:hypothetical protein
VLPITWKGILVALSSRWLGMDNRFARTFINLTKRPTVVIKEYLAGNRVKYIGPISYLIVMTALYLLSFNLFGISTEEFMRNAADSFGGFQVDKDPEVAQKQLEFMETYMSVFSRNMRLMVASIIPFIAMGLALFYRGKRNYLENFLVVSYLNSHLLWVSILFVGLSAVFGFAFYYVTMAISIGYFIWAVGTLNPTGNRIWSYFKALLCWVVSYFFFVIFMSIFAVVTVIIIMVNG